MKDDWFCKLCKLQFDKKVVFDLHQKLVHGIDSLRLIRIKDKKTQMCTKNSIITNKSTIFERKNKNNMRDIWLPSHDEHATATCATANRFITEVPESNAIGSSTKVSESCYTTSTNLEIENFVSSISFDDEKNLDIKVEHKHDPEISFVGYENIVDTNPTGKIPSATFTETPKKETNLPTNNLSRIEVIEKLGSLEPHGTFDLSRSLTDLQNLLRENLMRAKCKKPVTTSQPTKSLLVSKKKTGQTRQVKESESTTTVLRPRNDHLSNSYKENLSKQNKLLADEDEVRPFK